MAAHDPNAGTARPPERVITIDEPDLLAFVVVDSTRLGPAFGGVRRARYADAQHGLADARRLARAMSRKCALAGLAAGGAKTVIVAREDDRPEESYRRLAAHIEALGGAYVCGPDVGTGPGELAWLRAGTAHVNPPTNDASVATARGVVAALRGALGFIATSDRLEHRRYAVQGLGGVGALVADALLDAEASVVAWDVDPSRCEQAWASAEGRRGQLLVPESSAAWDEASTGVDVYVPCALGGVLRPDTEAAWQLVCGSANNQHTGPRSEASLHAAGIWTAPDIVTSAGAVIEGVTIVLGGEDARERAREQIDAIGPRTCEILEHARDRDLPPASVARALGDALLV